MDNTTQTLASPSICLDELLARCLGNLELAAQAIDAFEAQFQDDLEELLAADEVADVRRLAHRMKGGAANVAAKPLANCLSEVVDAAQTEQRQEINARLDALRRVDSISGRIGLTPRCGDALRDAVELPTLPLSAEELTMRVLIAEDDLTSAIILRGFLQELGYEAEIVGDGRAALERIQQQEYRIVISDWEMPQMDGLELCRRVRANSGAYTYIILLTCRSESGCLVSGLEAGADDFLVKPFDPQELRVRMLTAERIVQMEGRDLVIFALAKLAESRAIRKRALTWSAFAQYVRMLAEHLSRHDEFRDQIDVDFVRMMYLTCPLHDIGKVGVPDQVLLKPGPLTESERKCMQQHTTAGADTLGAAPLAHPSAEFLRMAQDIAWTHHERFDGGGYPRGIGGEEIPISGRIMAVADVYDALTTRRVYKPAYSHDVARDIILGGAGGQFDPRVVEAFAACEAAFVRTRQTMSDSRSADRPGESSAAPSAGRPALTVATPTFFTATAP